MWTCSELACTSGANSLQSISETGKEVSVSNRQNHLLVFHQKITAIELSVVSQPYSVALLQLRATSGCLRDNPNARFWHNVNIAQCPKAKLLPDFSTLQDNNDIQFSSLN